MYGREIKKEKFAAGFRICSQWGDYQNERGLQNDSAMPGGMALEIFVVELAGR